MIKNKKIIMTILILINVIVVLLLVAIFIWGKYQNSISATPEQILQRIQYNKYFITNVKEINQDNVGPLSCYENGGLNFDWHEGELLFRVSILNNSTWKSAKAFSKALNNLDHQMNGGFGYSFYYGTLTIVVGPAREASDDGWEFVKNDERLYVIGEELRKVIYLSTIKN